VFEQAVGCQPSALRNNQASPGRREGLYSFWPPLFLMSRSKKDSHADLLMMQCKNIYCVAPSLCHGEGVHNSLDL
jgi:hypothetical protein